MKQPADYLLDAWQPDPEPWPKDGRGYVPTDQAERAVERALADADKYYRLLLRALRPPTPAPAALTQYTQKP